MQELFEGKLVDLDYVELMKRGEVPPIRDWQELPTWIDRVRAFLASTATKDNWVKIVDLSKWNDESIQQIIDMGFQGGIIKATQNTFTDPKFDTYANQASVLNFPIGVYHFSDPAGKPAIQQAKYFSDVTKGVAQLSYNDDAEWTGNLSPTNLNLWHKDFMGELSVNITDKKKGIYTRAEWWNTKVAPAPWASEFDLWVARWAEWLNGPWSDGKYIPRDWTEWVLWQYKSTGGIDYNYFHGTWEEFVAHYMPEPTPPPVDPEIEIRLSKLEKEFAEHKEKSEADIIQLQTDLTNLKGRVDIIEQECCGKEESATLMAYAVENVVVFNILDYDKSCEEFKITNPDYIGPDGKPIAEPPPIENRVVYEAGSTFKINASAYMSCKDNPFDYIIHGSGYDFAVVADGQPGERNLVRIDKINIL